MEFRSPLFFLLLVMLLPLAVLVTFRRKGVSFTYSSADFMKGLPSGWRQKFRYFPLVLRFIILVLFIIALAGPQRPLAESQVSSEGVHIMLALDTSTSMATRDFKLNGEPQSRLTVVKKVVREFVSRRKTDRIGLVAFAARPYTACPLTSDYAWLDAQLARIDFGLMEDGTAIGSAIASAVNRLKNIHAKSKVIVLLTDGINNAGSIDPQMAAEMARAYGIKIYTIGAGSKDGAGTGAGMIPGFLFPPGALAIDEKTLQQMADKTGGQYFRATDTAALEDIYRQIDALEKTAVRDTGYRQYEELFAPLIWAALVLLIIEIILGRTLFLKIP